MTEHKNFDSLLTAIGIGRWTFLMFAPYFLWALLLPYYSLGGVFYNPSVDHWCSVPELANSSWTLEQKLNYSIPWEDNGGGLERSKCRVFVRDYDAVAHLPWSTELATSVEEAAVLPSRPCEHWNYDTSTFTSTVTMKWDLVCGRASLSPFFQSFYFFGTAVGEPLMGLLADRFGRRWVISGSAVLFAMTAVSSALVPLYALALTGRFMLGALHAIIGPAYIQGMEACPVKVRTVIGLLSTAPFALTGMLFGAWAYLIRDWQTLQMVCAIPALFLIAHIPFMDESPRWLTQQGRFQEAANTLLKGARWQGVTIPPRQELVTLLEKFRQESIESETEERKKAEEGARGCWRESTVLVRTPALRRITIGLFGCWFFTGVTFWGMSLSGTTFSTDPFLYLVLSSLMEIPGYCGFTPIVARFGRRSVLSFNFAVCSCAILTILATPSSYTWMIFSLALVGKLFITGSYGLIYLVSSELYPTCVRSRGLNLSSMMARFGSIISPFIIKLLATTHWWAPSVLFGACAGLGTLFALLLPDSSNKPMADTVDQLELLYASSSRTSSSNSIEKGVATPLTATQREGDAEV